MSKVTLPSQRQDETVPLTNDKDDFVPIQTTNEHTKRTKAKAYISILALPLAILAYFAFSFTCLHTPNHDMASASPVSGWRQRATAHPDKASFHPTAETFASGLIRSTRLYPRGLVVGIFTPDVAVDSTGRVLQLKKEDWEALNKLAKKATSSDIPLAGGFRNQWRIKHPRTDYPISWLRVSHSGDVKEVSVYGHSATTTELTEPVHGLTHLPEVIQEVITDYDEGRSVEDDGEGDSALAKLVADIVSGTTED